MSPQPLALTDEQITAVFAAAHPLSPDRRSDFLADVARELAALHEIGDGALHRIIMAVQRQYFDAPDLSRGHVPRWARKDGGIRGSTDP
jgi:hypothetical protein